MTVIAFPAASSKPTVATPSAEISAMGPDLELIADVRGGLRRMRLRRQLYLPQYESESREEYDRRVAASTWRPEFVDALNTLASRPFARPIALPEDAPEPIARLARDVDADGNDITVFSRKFFVSGLADGVALLLIDAPSVPEARTVAEQKQAGFRPYWALYNAASVVDYRSKVIGGQKQIVHLRLRETVLVEDGEWGSKKVEQIRVLRPGSWELWREEATGPNAKEWRLFDSGTHFTNSAGGVPVVPLFLGERLGDFAARPPLIDLAFQQIELYRALSRLEEVMIYSASPMLCATGVTLDAAGGSLAIGPKRVLTAPEGGSWGFIQPSADVLREIREQVASIVADMQRLGLQPQLARPGVTATEVSLASAKASSQLEAWALALKDALETALAETIRIMLPDDRKAVGAWAPVIGVHHDFSSDLALNAEAALVVDAAKAGVISMDFARGELLRRGIILAENGDEDAEGEAE